MGKGKPIIMFVFAIVIAFFFTVLTRFQSFLNGLSCREFQVCQDKDCDNWFVKTYSGKKRQRRFCCNKCASRNNQYDKRHNPDREDEYQKDKDRSNAYYAEKCEREYNERMKQQ